MRAIAQNLTSTRKYSSDKIVKTIVEAKLSPVQKLTKVMFEVWKFKTHHNNGKVRIRVQGDNSIKLFTKTKTKVITDYRPKYFRYYRRERKFLSQLETFPITVKDYSNVKFKEKDCIHTLLFITLPKLINRLTLEEDSIRLYYIYEYHYNLYNSIRLYNGSEIIRFHRSFEWLRRKYPRLDPLNPEDEVITQSWIDLHGL